MGSTRLLTAKTINCSRADPMSNKCSEYSSINRNLFLARGANPLMHSVINYFFDFTTKQPIERRQYPSNQRIIGYSSLGQQERLVLMRDIDLHSISFDIHMDQMRAVTSNNTAYKQGANLFTLNTFDELSRNRLFLFGIDLYRSDDSGF